MTVVPMPGAARRVSTLAVVRMSFQKVLKVTWPGGEMFTPATFGRPIISSHQATAEDVLRELMERLKNGPIVLHSLSWGEPVKPTPIRKEPVFVDTRPCDSEPN